MHPALGEAQEKKYRPLLPSAPKLFPVRYHHPAKPSVIAYQPLSVIFISCCCNNLRSHYLINLTVLCLWLSLKRNIIIKTVVVCSRLCIMLHTRCRTLLLLRLLGWLL